MRLRPMETSRRFGAAPFCAHAKPRCATKPPAVAAARVLTKSRRLRIAFLLISAPRNAAPYTTATTSTTWGGASRPPKLVRRCPRRNREHHQRVGCSASAVGTATGHIHHLSVGDCIETMASGRHCRQRRPLHRLRVVRFVLREWLSAVALATHQQN